MPASVSQGLAYEQSALRLPQTRFKADQTGLTARAGRLSLRTSSPGDRRPGALDTSSHADAGRGGPSSELAQPIGAKPIQRVPSLVGSALRAREVRSFGEHG